MIYLCIPAHDEARTLGVLLWKIRRVFKEFERDYRVLVLDDASTDDTAEVLKQYAQVLPLEALSAERRMGHGAALDRLVRYAVDQATYPKRDIVVTLQGDFTEGPEHVVSMVKTIEGGADLVTGVVEEHREPPRNVRWGRWVANKLLRDATTRSGVADPTCGLRAYRAVVIKKALRTLDETPLAVGDGYAANVEMLRLLSPHARRMTQEPVVLRYDLRRRPSRMKLFKTTRDLMRVRGRPWAPREEAVG